MVEKMPAPITAPMPSMTRSKVPRVRRRRVAALRLLGDGGLDVGHGLGPEQGSGHAGREASISTYESGATVQEAGVLVVMRQDATREQIRGVVEAIEARGFKAHPIPGAQRTAIGITGNKGALDGPVFESLPGVLEVIPVSHAYKLVSREVKPEDTVVRVGGVAVGGPELVVVAGPCAVESREQTLTVARAVKAAGAHLLRGGAFKPRTSPYSFQGLGEEGLRDPGRGARGDGPARGHGGGGRRGRRPRGALRRRHPDRRAQHAELLAAQARGTREEAGAPEARDVGHARGVPDVGRVHPLRGQLRR